MTPTADLIARYREQVAIHSTFNPGDAESLARTNAAADRLRAIATDVGKRGPDAVAQFARLIDDADFSVRLWAAFHSLEVMDSPDELVRRAFAVLEAHSAGDSISAFGTRLRLRELRQQRSSDGGGGAGGAGGESDAT